MKQKRYDDGKQVARAPQEVLAESGQGQNVVSPGDEGGEKDLFQESGRSR